MIGTDISHAAALLRKGKLVAIPTETVYGLAGNALNEDSVLAIYEAKKRPHFNPLIIHLASFTQIPLYAQITGEATMRLARRFMPGPLTLLLPKREAVPDLVTAGSPRVAIRIPSHPVAHLLLEQLDIPLAAPSANPFGYISPTTAAHVEEQLGNSVDYILDGGPCELGIESTIVGFSENGDPVIYRHGAIPAEEIEEAAGRKASFSISREADPEAPGMLASHYAPRTPVHLGNIGQLLEQFREKKTGVLSFGKVYRTGQSSANLVLSPSGDLREAAKNLFAHLRVLDASGLDVILAEELPEEGIGRAINDRLRRAAVKAGN